MSEFRERLSSTFDKAEHLYLRTLRACVLVFATILILFAAWKLITGLYNVSKSESSVEEEVAVVTPQDLVSKPVEMKAATKTRADALSDERKFYSYILGRYHNLYSTKFEPYRKSDDKPLSEAEFNDLFLETDARLKAIGEGELDFAQDKVDLEGLLKTVSEAAALPETKTALEKYRSAKKVSVTRKVDKTRQEQRRSWDSYSTNCQYWYESPMGCPTIRTVTVPYTTNETVMEYPKGTVSHFDLFKGYHERYIDLLVERRESAASKAEQERFDIRADNVKGAVDLDFALKVAAGFLVLMFFFLMIAIERHLRKRAALA